MKTSNTLFLLSFLLFTTLAFSVGPPISALTTCKDHVEKDACLQSCCVWTKCENRTGVCHNPEKNVEGSRDKLTCTTFQLNGLCQVQKTVIVVTTLMLCVCLCIMAVLLSYFKCRCGKKEERAINEGKEYFEL